MRERLYRREQSIMGEMRVFSGTRKPHDVTCNNMLAVLSKCERISNQHAARESKRRRRRRDRGCRNSRLSTTDARPPWSRRSRGPGAVAAIKAVGLLPPLGQQHPAALLGLRRSGPAITRGDGQSAERQQEEAEEAGDRGSADVHIHEGT